MKDEDCGAQRTMELTLGGTQIHLTCGLNSHPGPYHQARDNIDGVWVTFRWWSE